MEGTDTPFPFLPALCIDTDLSVDTVEDFYELSLPCLQAVDSLRTYNHTTLTEGLLQEGNGNPFNQARRDLQQGGF